jgi:membrane protease YdiL (CAAX protease family)
MNNNIRFPFRFFLITFIWSWILWTPLVLGSMKIIPVSGDLISTLTFPLIFLGAFGPLAGALFVLNRGTVKGSTRKYLQSFLDINLGWKTYIITIIIFGGSTFIAWFFPELLGEERLSMLLPSIWVFIPCLLFMIFLGGGQEEFGWRGYALPILENKFGLWLANIILGLIWAFWHIPLWFITGTSQTYMNFGGFILLMVGYSFIYSWIRKISGNKPFSALYVHGLSDAFVSVMPTMSIQKDIPQTRFWIWVILTLFIGILITALREKKSPNRVEQNEKEKIQTVI